jgi:hypothetical protein
MSHENQKSSGNSYLIVLQKIKDQVTELDKKTRTMVGLLNKIHSTPSKSSQNSHGCSDLLGTKKCFNAVPVLLDSIRPVLHSCRDANAGLAALIPAHQFWRWKDQWANSLRTAIFAASLVEYLTSGKLISLAHVSDILGSKHFLLV